jgi:hypothetical protein
MYLERPQKQYKSNYQRKITMAYKKGIEKGSIITIEPIRKQKDIKSI